MKILMNGAFVAAGFILGAAIYQSDASPQIDTQPKTLSCDDTKLGEVAEFVKSDPGSSAQLKRAVAGDAESALDLAVMFGKIDFGRMMCFERMAAENGGKVSQANYGEYLLKSKDPLARARGKYWVDRSSQSVKKR